MLPSFSFLEPIIQTENRNPQERLWRVNARLLSDDSFRVRFMTPEMREAHAAAGQAARASALDVRASSLECVLRESALDVRVVPPPPGARARLM